jgi:hypothetical protein
MSWQEPVAWIIVAGAFAYLVRRIAFAGYVRAKKRGPDVPLSRLKRK